MKIFNYLTMLAVALCAAACSYTNHFLPEGEEDEPQETLPYDRLNNVKISAYDTWTYINLETGETETHPDATEWIYSGTGNIREAQQAENIGITWHVAVHRYEFKTNGAAVFNTKETDITAVTELPEGDYVPDETASYETESVKDNGGYVLSMDLSKMMDGSVGYAHYPIINRLLCNGITRTATGAMPPTIYDTTKHVFVLKWDDGSWATLQVTGTSHTATGVSNYMSFNYKYHAAQ